MQLSFERIMSKGKSLVKLGTKKAQKVLDQLQEIDPTIIEHSKGLAMDVENIFQLFCSFTGDLQRTAHAAGVTPQAVAELAEEHKWTTRLSAIFELKRSGKAGDLEKCLSRAINFVQAHRMRIVLEKLIAKLYEKTADQLLEECTVVQTDKDGNEIRRSLNMRPLSDLCAALQKVHELTYLALVDSVTERARKNDNGDPELSLSSIHSLISQAMSDTQNSAGREEFAAKLAKASESLKPDGPA
jgi:hypothetical protein